MTVHPVRYGAPALDRLDALVAEAQGSDALAPVTVVVPTNYVGVAARRALARRGGIAAVSFLTVYRLAELLGAAPLAASSRRPVSTPVVAGAVRMALDQIPGCFALVREHPSTEEALLASHRELRDVSDTARRVLAAASDRAGDVVAIHRLVTRTLAPDWYDETDLLAAATAVAAAGGAGVAALGPVVVYLPQQLTLGAGRLVAALAERARVHVIIGLTGGDDADRGPHRVLAAIGTALPPHDGAARPPSLPADVRVITVVDADDEVRAARREVVAAARRGVPLERIGLCYATAEPYARLCGELLDAAAIPRNGRATLALRERVVARTLLELLALPERGFGRNDVFALLAGAPLRTADGRRAPTAAWERVSREAGVVAGPTQWEARLAALVTERRAEAAELRIAGDEAPPWAADRAERRAEQAESLRVFVAELAERLSVLETLSTWTELARHTGQLVGRYLGGDSWRASWPEAERVAADKVLAALDRLGGLDGVDPTPSVERFRRTLELELDADLGRVGRLGQGVFVGPVGLALGQDLDVTIVLGLAEGTFPSRPVDDSLLPDRERSRAGGELPLSADRLHRQHHELLAVLAAAGQRAVLLFPRGDLRRSSERVPSRWLLDVLGERVGRRVWSDDVAGLDEPWLEHVASFAGGVSHAEFPATAQEHRLRRLAASPTGVGEVAADPAFRRGATLLRARRSAAFTAYDGNVAGLHVPSPADSATLVSPTRLERWARCPLQYFFSYVLRVAEIENPEAVLRLSPLDKGGLLHDTLDRFIAEVLARPAADQPGPDDPWSEADVERVLAIFDEEATSYVARGLTGRELFWRQDRRAAHRDLRELLRHDSIQRRSLRARPAATELAFGFGDTVPPVQVDVPGGAVRFRGMIDRVDRTDDASLIVTDYKTGRSEPYSGLGETEPTLGGTRLQLPVYALAARLALGDADTEVTAEYWFATVVGRYVHRPLPLTADVHKTVVTDLGTIVGGIEGGQFPAHPRRPMWQRWIDCPVCDPDGAGTAERWREWSRKKDAPELEAYRALAARQGADSG